MKFGRFCLSENFSISSKLLNFFIKWWRKYYGYLFNYVESIMRSLLSFFFSSLFIFYWRIIPLQNFAVLCQTSTRISHAAAAAKSLQLCPTLCDPWDGSPPGSPIPGILHARTLEWVAISFSNAWKWKVKVKLLSRVRLLATPWTAAYQAPLSMGFSRQEYWSGVLKNTIQILWNSTCRK